MAQSHSEALKQRILDIRILNWKHQYFVPIGPLRRLLTESAIRSVFKECGIEVYLMDEAIRAVLSNGQRLFGILNSIGQESAILEVRKHTDSYLDKPLDATLPYETEHDVQKFLPSQNLYRGFFDAQWMFSSPVFHHKLSHRRLHANTVLPFTAVNELTDNEGATATVSRVELSALHQTFEKPKEGTISLVLKTLTIGNADDEKFRHEQHILSLLRALRHPNIIEFFAAYSLKEHSTFVFAPADCNLNGLLRGGYGLSFSAVEMLDALRGLASAICHMHNYFLEPYDVQKIGCHYDIHPGNILVRGQLFILSDFGLSRLKDLDQGSKSGFGGGVLDYYAPECQDWAKSFKKGIIGKSSDIWSLGCIMAEIVTFMVHGSNSIVEFDELRKYGGFGTFHAHGTRHEKVAQWLQNLSQSETFDHVRPLVSLTEEMLSIDEGDRPGAWEVLNRLSYLLHQIRYHTALEMFEKIKPSMGYNFEIELERFKIWSNHVGLTNVDQGGSPPSDFYSRQDYQGLEDATKQLEKIIDDLGSSFEADIQIGDSFTNTILHTQVRTHIDKLWQLQGSHSQHLMARELESIVLNGDSEAIQEGEDITTFSRPQLLLVIRQALKAIDDHEKLPQNSLIVNRTRILPWTEWEECLLGRFTTTDGDELSSITELYHYDDVWIDRPDELVTRLHKLVALLSRNDMISNFPILRALAFCHLPERQAYGIIFESPKIIDTSTGQQISQTLAHLIKTTSRRSTRPSLDDVYALAYKIANTVLSFHKAGWLHKGISAYKILLFPETESCVKECLPSARLIGFEYSRATNDHFTAGPPNNIKTARYRHPEYRERISKFEEKFDYYSVGVVLLELGRWKTLESMMKKMPNLNHNASPTEITQYLLETEVLELRSYMGVRYYQAVNTCLERFGIRREKFDSPGVWNIFEKEVLGVLEEGLSILT